MFNYLKKFQTSENAQDVYKNAHRQRIFGTDLPLHLCADFVSYKAIGGEHHDR
jgi:hypothetical protein